MTIRLIGLFFNIVFMNIVVLTVWGSAAAQSPQIGTARNAIGNLIVIRPDGIQEKLSGQGSVQLFEGDVLKTEPGSQALIEFKDGVQVALNENTAFKILSRWQKGNPVTRIIRVKQGEVWVKTGDGPKQFEVETPVATASVRETEFNMKVQEDGQSTLTVIQGIVEFGTAFGTCPIRPSTISYGVRGKKCTKPAPTDVAPATAWVNAVRQVNVP
jgi:hypothetical protein